MTDSSQLSLLEFLLVAGLIGLMGWEVWRSWTMRDPASIFRPTVILSVILAYYCLLSPLQGLGSAGWQVGSVSLRQGMVWAWAGALVFYASVLVGFYGFKPWSGATRPSRPFPVGWSLRMGRLLNGIGLGLHLLVLGPAVFLQINPFAAASIEEELQGWGFAAFLGVLNPLLSFSLNLLIPGTLLLTAVAIQRRRGWWEVLLWTLVALGLFTTSGFRWRLAVLLVPMVILWSLARQRRPRLIVIAAFAAGLIAVAGFVGQTRTYGQGLTLRGADLSPEAVVTSGLFEGSVFYTTGGVMEQAPDRYPFVGIKPLLGAAAIFVPRAIWAEKPGTEYATNAIALLMGSPGLAFGGAFLNYAEYYLIFGWPSLVAISVLLGWVLRSLYAWFLVHRTDTSVQVSYVLSASFLYVVVSRGYLPGVVLIFTFTVLPLFLVRRFVRAA